MGRSNERDRYTSLSANRATSTLDYTVNESLVTKRPGLGSIIPLSKQSNRWEEDNYGSIRPKRMFIISDNGLVSFDSVKASH